jgi:general secretion pathway protein K
MNRKAAQGDPSQGIILIVVLWVVAMMTVIVVALSSYSQKNVALAGLEADRLRTETALQSGIDVGVALILATNARDRVFFDGAAVAADIGGGRQVELNVRDAAGLIDINRANGALLNAMGLMLELPRESVAALVEKIIGQRPPPKEDAGNAEKQLLPAVFMAPSQLYGLDGSDPGMIGTMLPFVSLYSTDGRINPMAAPDLIMQSIPGLTPENRSILAEARQRKQWKTPAAQAVLERHAQFLSVNDARIFIIDVKLVSGDGLIAGSRVKAVAAVNDSGDVPFHILAWSW